MNRLALTHMWASEKTSPLNSFGLGLQTLVFEMRHLRRWSPHIQK